MNNHKKRKNRSTTSKQEQHKETKNNSKIEDNCLTIWQCVRTIHNYRTGLKGTPPLHKSVNSTFCWSVCIAVNYKYGTSLSDKFYMGKRKEEQKRKYFL